MRTSVEEDEFPGLDDTQKRRLRALRRQYRASGVEIKNNGWEIEITFMDGSKVNVNSKMLKLKAPELQGES
ncbi:MAG: hypothetical protein KDD44_00970 [Bdellovibrionales bacterium]|nr:hypothetical protein [Bdellovibrionales bacterium]